jgi:hypothetical protein
MGSGSMSSWARLYRSTNTLDGIKIAKTILYIKKVSKLNSLRYFPPYLAFLSYRTEKEYAQLNTYNRSRAVSLLASSEGFVEFLCIKKSRRLATGSWGAPRRRIVSPFE